MNKDEKAKRLVAALGMGKYFANIIGKDEESLVSGLFPGCSRFLITDDFFSADSPEKLASAIETATSVAEKVCIENFSEEELDLLLTLSSHNAFVRLFHLEHILGEAISKAWYKKCDGWGSEEAAKALAEKIFEIDPNDKNTQ